jgi:hypothetical protein
VLPTYLSCTDDSVSQAVQQAPCWQALQVWHTSRAALIGSWPAAETARAVKLLGSVGLNVGQSGKLQKPYN